MGASLLSCHWTLVHLDHRAEERKMSYGRILERNKRKMEKRRFPFLRAVNPRVPKRVLGGWLKKCRNLKFQMGITGAPFCPIGINLVERLQRDLEHLLGGFPWGLVFLETMGKREFSKKGKISNFKWA